MADASRTYRLDPPDRTGVMLGLSAAQVACLGAALLGGSWLIATGIVVPAALVVAAVLVAAAFVRVGPTPVIELAPTVLRWVAARGPGRARWLAPLPLLGDSADRLPDCLAGQRLIAVTNPAEWGFGGRLAPVGVVVDEPAGTYAATVRVTGRQFALLDRDEQDRLVQAWGDALGVFCRDRTAVTQLRWAEWTAPGGLGDHLAWVQANRSGEVDAVSASYDQVVAAAGSLSARHETLVSVQVHGARVRLTGRHRGDRHVAAVEALLGEVRMLVTRLTQASLEVTGPLSPVEVVRAARARLDPTALEHFDRLSDDDGDLGQRCGLSLADAAPLATRTGWSEWGTDGSWHRAFVVHDWPRLEVPAAWMSDLLLASPAVRSVCVFAEPVPTHRSQQAITRAAAKLDADADQRARTGFRVGAVHRRAMQAVTDREEELVAGYPEFDYCGVVVVTAPTVDRLDDACAEVTQLAATAGLDLRALHGRHDIAAAAALPFARGVAARTGTRR